MSLQSAVLLSMSSTVLITDPPAETYSSQLDQHSTHPATVATGDRVNDMATTDLTSVFTHNHHTFSSSPQSSSPVAITDISHSPHRIRGVWMGGMDGDQARGSPIHEIAEEECRQNTPNSPLLTAMREAVDSINQYEDFEILEKIGAGFYAEVFKVITTCVQFHCVLCSTWCFPLHVYGDSYIVCQHLCDFLEVSLLESGVNIRNPVLHSISVRHSHCGGICFHCSIGIHTCIYIYIWMEECGSNCKLALTT